MLTDALGAELFVGDLVATLTGGQNAMVLSGTVLALHEVKITIKVISAEFVGEPIGHWTKKKPEPGASKQLNSYRVFRLGPCEHELEDVKYHLPDADLRFEVTRNAAPDQPVTVKAIHLPTGCLHTVTHMSGLQAKDDAIRVLERIVGVHRGLFK